MKDEFKIDELATKKAIELFKITTQKDFELLKKDIEGVEAKLQKEIIHSRNEIILWVVGFLAANGIIQHWLSFSLICPTFSIVYCQDFGYN